MIIRANIKYSVTYRGYRIYLPNAVIKEHRLSNLIYLDEDMNQLDISEKDFNKVGFILRYFYSNFDSLRGTSSELEFDSNNLKVYLFIPVEGYTGAIRVINTKIRDKLNLCEHLRDVSYQDIRTVYHSLNKDIS